MYYNLDIKTFGKYSSQIWANDHHQICLFVLTIVYVTFDFSKKTFIKKSQKASVEKTASKENRG